ncbi:double-strand break repair protein AddB [Xinfangfangia sp. CPCC 101601]|uniref:Double-strand break repair protein AddB n=1 Tax=Pseudogemmobacter lacusdianii TaxID=3069608 RepID=A0ABU0VTZ2_9RHOB|nr:double-strand break repair protein AddB [Xinfangfangia sp. CPCC 101601]MDQ2065197.1 double-strand break repair protein AddB [Xinfangfangia sp. CPCC 101601]
MIFPPSSMQPRVFGLPPGVDFPQRLVDGLLARLQGQPPEALARVTIYLNTARIRRRVQQEFAKRGASFLPKLPLIGDLAGDPLLTGIEPTLSSLGRRLELAVLIERLLVADPTLAPRSALFDLADSLAGLMDEMRSEGISPEALASLDVSGHSAHWGRAQRFIALAEGFFAHDARPDGEARQRLAVQRQIARWQALPPEAPVLLAGSTGSRGTTALMMQAVAQLPQGAVVLPGFDFDMPEALWTGMQDALVHEAHPQFRLAGLLHALEMRKGDVGLWTEDIPADSARNHLISLALRPAPVTDQWISDGPALGDLIAATKGLTLIEAPSPRAEAAAVALALREAVEQGLSASLVSNDRNLTRRVAALLDRWGIRPDDSAGQPLQQTAPGRFLRLVAGAMAAPLTLDRLLALLKHPLTHSGTGRGPHLRLTREVELHLRKRGPAFPDASFVRDWSSAFAAKKNDPDALAWGLAVAAFLETAATTHRAPLPQLVTAHLGLAKQLARGIDPTGSGRLWEKETGEKALEVMHKLRAEAPEGLVLSAMDYPPLLAAILSKEEARSAVLTDERVQILGVQEARIQGAGLVILGGLTEGAWPETPASDPWLNRRLRRDAGLLLPERKVGLSAHDFQIAVAGPKVILTRALRDAEAETVASRWLNRLVNLLSGLPATHGPEALAAMQARGQHYLKLAEALDAPLPGLPPARRPSPRPPLKARPRKLSITQIERLVTNPYDIYVEEVLRLRALNPLRPEADFRLRGEVVHQVLEDFLRISPLPQDPEAAADLLLQITERVLEAEVPWPVARADWLARMRRIALPFATATLRRDSHPVLLETKAALHLKGPDFTLTGKPDRIDVLPDGNLHVIDYKTGEPPSEPEMKQHRKQLHLAAVMALGGAFGDLGPRVATRITYQSMKPGLKERGAELTEPAIDQLREELEALLSTYLDPATGFTAQRAAVASAWEGDFDHLSRLGEWSIADAAEPEDLGDQE